MSKSEALIQQEIVVWFRNKFCLKHHDPKCSVFSVPNERKEYMETKALINTGLLSGVSDLIVVRPNEVIFVEVKTEIGRQSEKQKKFQATVEALGFRYIVVRSLEQFKLEIS